MRVFKKSCYAVVLAAAAIGAMVFAGPAQAGVDVPVGDLPHQVCGRTVPVVGAAIPLNQGMADEQCVSNPGNVIGGTAKDLMRPQKVPTN
jgi:hypothetical protein